MSLWDFLIILLTLWRTYASVAAESLKVCLDGLGCVQGAYRDGYQADKYEAFMGIPFAKPPIGDLRLRNPEPADAWSGVLDATEPKPNCIQKNYLLTDWPVSGDEDCLYLNLYRPAQRTAANLPVLFYIHGGGFFSGTAHPGIIGPEYFMDTGEVILVVVAYRLGPFGFLSTADADMPGNFGLKDQQLALKWVRAHVAAFGGDPDSVTIFGHSAGGSAVHLHMLAPSSKGLFQRAVMMSGSALAPFSDVLHEPRSQAVQVAQACGLNNAADLSAADLGKALRGVDAVALLNAGTALKSWHIYPLMHFRPVVEQSSWANAFLTALPVDLSRDKARQPVPWIMGAVPGKGEGAVMAANVLESDQLRQELNQNFDKLLWEMLGLEQNPPNASHHSRVMETAFREYLHGVHEMNSATMDGLMELFGDVNFLYPFYRTLDDMVESASNRPMGLFEFNYRGPYSYSVVFSGGSARDYGVVHLDDMLYLFRSPLMFPQDYAKDSTDAAVVRRYAGLYVEFAKTGKVTSFDKLGACNVKEIDGVCNWLEIVKAGDTFSEVVGQAINGTRMRLWNGLL